jgi:hypothetical protein
LNAAGPELAVLADSVVDGKRHLRLRLTSPRGALVGSVYIPAAAQVEEIAVDGEAIPMGFRPGTPHPRQRGWRSVTYHTVPAQGAVLDIVLASTQPADWYVVDHTYGLPPSAAALAAARPRLTASPQDGDGTLVSRKVRI